MIDENDLSLVEPEGDPVGEPSEPAPGTPGAAPPAPQQPQPQPLVVIEYRNRLLPSLLLIPPLVLLALGAVAVYFRAQIADWPGLLGVQIVPRVEAARPAAPPEQPPALAQAASTDRAAGEEAVPAGGGDAELAELVPFSHPPTPQEFPLPEFTPWPHPGANRSDPAIVPLAAETAEPEPAAPAGNPAGGAPAPGALALQDRTPVEKPERANPQPGIGFDPPGSARLQSDPAQPRDGEPAAGASADMPDDEARLHDRTRKANEDIERAAREEAARRKWAERQKGVWREETILSGQQRHEQEVREALRTIETDRPRFRADLQHILTNQHNLAAASASIQQLCEQYGLDPLPEVQDRVNYSLTYGSTVRYGRVARVQSLRRLGMPEPAILDDLAYSESKKLSMRNGPRNADEVWVRAARQLLAVPLAQAPAARPAAGAAAAPVRPAVPAARPGTSHSP